MKVYSGSEIRNVAVVGHNDTGKTSLVTQLLFNAGAITRLGRIDDGTTVTDFDQDEIDRKHSISTAVAFAEWQNTKINLIDTPGFGIFVMETRTAMRVVDAAAIVVSGVTGVEVSTERVWKFAEEFEGKVRVGKLDTDQYPNIATEFQISAIPTVLIFHNGKVAERLMGVNSETKYRESLANVGA